ncbi:flagellin [Magnetospira sp. QH-2]|uniref:flagellin n=1 Tax=Magnetospira sp. (strain QH-2) TaxID=1288970 RepID=UPI0003E817AF|nr:flagellin [Magnetospira sp. QH-2]CCQ74136.1 Putative flagellar hook-associated protein 3 (HAP3) FlgL [Magnetospira sp. QH-2]
MVTRIADLSFTTSMVGRLQQLQANLLEKQVQVSSEKKSQQYSGISDHSQRLVSIENLTALNDRYVRNNDIVGTRLEVQWNAYQATEITITDMRDRLETFLEFSTSDETAVDDIQDWAYKSMLAIESQLNAFVDGQYLFAGSKTHTKPVDFGLTNLSDFQAKYDGEKVTYPTTRDAHLVETSLSEDTTGNSTSWLSFNATTNIITASTSAFGTLKAGSVFTVSGSPSNDGNYSVRDAYAFDTSALDAAPTITLPDASTLTNADFGTLSYSNPVTITAATASSLSGIAVGDSITIAGSTDADNDGTYTVSANTGTVLTVVPNKITVATAFDTSALDAAPTIDSSVSGVGDLTAADYGTLSFTTPNTVVAATGGSLANLSVGDVFTISNATDSDNDGKYTVLTNDGTTMTVTSSTLTTEAGVAGTITASNYFKGDDTVLTHRIDKDFTIDMDINGIHPAFEKAIRAMGIIAQGTFGTAGGLDANENRVTEARWLLDSALDQVTGEAPPYGTEVSGDMVSLGFNIGFKQILMEDTKERFTKLNTVLTVQADEIENVDLALAIAEFTDASTALQAAYQAFAQAQSLSLADYL